jgi:hypothetical protein
MGEMADAATEEGLHGLLDHEAGHCDIDSPCQYCEEELGSNLRVHRASENREKENVMGTNLVKYGSYSPEAAERESKQLGSTDFLKVEVGKNKLRILPPAVGEDSPFRVVPQHAVEVPGKQWPMRFQCPGKGCPACAESQRLSRTGNPKDRESAYQIGIKQRVFATVINRKEPERGPLVWEFGKKVHDQLKKLRLNEDAGGDFCDPYNGFDVIIERTGTKKEDTVYTVFPARNSTKLAEDEEQMAEWLDNRPDLDKFAKIMTVDDVRRLLRGDGSDNDDAGEDETPHAKGPKRRSVEDDLEV